MICQRLDIPRWPNSHDFKTLQTIMPLDAIWDALDEQQLEWDPSELAIYMDPSFGDDLRLLHENAKAPTVLHSWGHINRPCPPWMSISFQFDQVEKRWSTWIWAHIFHQWQVSSFASTRRSIAVHGASNLQISHATQVGFEPTGSNCSPTPSDVGSISHLGWPADALLGLDWGLNLCACCASIRMN